MYNDIFEKPKGIVTALKTIADAICRICDDHHINMQDLLNCLSIIMNGAKWLTAINKLAEHQIVFTDEMSLELSEKINSSENVDDIISHYYFDNDDKINNLIDRCEKAQAIKDYKLLFGQIIQVYKLECYQLACIGLFCLMDGVLADISRMNITNFTNRIKEIEHKASLQKTLGTSDRIEVAIYIAFNKFEQSKELSMFYGGDFSNDESNLLKRDWLLHGRTHRDYEKNDFLKALLCLDAIIFLSNKNIEEEHDYEYL